MAKPQPNGRWQQMTRHQPEGQAASPVCGGDKKTGQSARGWRRDPL